MAENAESNRIEVVDKAVAYVLSFFDLFDYPLELHQLWRFLPAKADISEVASSLNRLIVAGRVMENKGMFFLTGRLQRPISKSCRLGRLPGFARPWPWKSASCAAGCKSGWMPALKPINC